jgi:rubredoxin
MENYVCTVCGYLYNPAEGDLDAGIPVGTAFADLPEDWVCPVCGAEKDDFEPDECGGEVGGVRGSKPLTTSH